MFPLFVASGCAQGIAWRAASYDPVAAGREPSKLSFIYFRSWYDPASTRFEEQVLLDPAVLAASRAFNCIVLDFASDEKLAAGWGLTKDPCFAVVAPSGDVLARGDRTVTPSELAAALNEAHSRFAGASPPASSPSSAPTAVP